MRHSGPTRERSNNRPLKVPGPVISAWDLYRQIADDNEPNIIVSPVSIRTAMAMLYAGARGDTARQLEETLRYRPSTDFHERMSALTNSLTEPALTSEGFHLTIANSLWGQTGPPLPPRVPGHAG